MIYNDLEISIWADRCGIKPLDAKRLNPASIDLTLSAMYRYPAECDWGELASALEQPMIMPPLTTLLVSTAEVVTMPRNAGGLLVFKSSIGRKGITMANAGWVDPGFHGSLTVCLQNISPWMQRLEPGMPFVQMVLYRCGNVDKAYSGKYQGQVGPTVAK